MTTELTFGPSCAGKVNANKTWILPTLYSYPVANIFRAYDIVILDQTTANVTNPFYWSVSFYH